MKSQNLQRNQDIKEYSTMRLQGEMRTKRQALPKQKLFKSLSLSMREMRRKDVKPLILLMI
jgi:hypothetical protein